MFAGFQIRCRHRLRLAQQMFTLLERRVFVPREHARVLRMSFLDRQRFSRDIHRFDFAALARSELELRAPGCHPRKTGRAQRHQEEFRRLNSLSHNVPFLSFALLQANLGIR